MNDTTADTADVMKQIIANVRKHPCLYNNELKPYKNYVLRDQAWEQIQEEIGLPGEECKKIWTRLRNAHTHAVMRRMNRASGPSCRKQLQKWRYEDEMAFLIPFLAINKKGYAINQKKKPEESVEDVELLVVDTEEVVENVSPKEEKTNESIKWEDEDLEIIDSEELQSELVESDEYQEFNHGEQEQHQTLKLKTDLEIANKNPKKRKINAEEDEVREARNERRYESKEIGNEVYLLFEYLAKTMSNLPQLDQIKLKGDIMKLVTSAELRAAENKQLLRSGRRKTVYRESVRHADSDTSYSDDPLT